LRFIVFPFQIAKMLRVLMKFDFHFFSNSCGSFGLPWTSVKLIIYSAEPIFIRGLLAGDQPVSTVGKKIEQ
jgi:hypothetical protein